MRIATVVGLLLLLVTAATGPAIAAQSVNNGSDANDFAAYIEERAQAHGISVDEYLAALKTQDELSWVVREVNTHPDQFGGISWDWKSPTPGFVLQYVGDEPPKLDPNVREVPVAHSHGELLKILGDLDLATAKLDARDAGLVSISIDDVANAVVIMLSGESQQVANLAEPYGDAVILRQTSVTNVPAACYDRTDCTPFRGGIQIVGNTLACTYGLNARYASGKAMTTAGHCDTQLDDFWYHAGNPIGASTRNGLLNGLDVDGLRVLTTTAEYPFNRIYSNDSYRSLAIVGTQGDSDLYFGEDLRRAGTNTSINCEITGYVKYKYWFLEEGWLYSAWGRATNCTAVGGDSGGPVWHTSATYGNLFVGLTSLADGTFAVQDDLLRTLNLIEWCTNSYCT